MSSPPSLSLVLNPCDHAEETTMPGRLSNAHTVAQSIPAYRIPIQCLLGSLTFTAPRPGGTVADPHRQGPHIWGYVLLPLAAPHHRWDGLVYGKPSAKGKESRPCSSGGRGSTRMSYEDSSGLGAPSGESDSSRVAGLPVSRRRQVRLSKAYHRPQLPGGYHDEPRAARIRAGAKAVPYAAPAAVSGAARDRFASRRRCC